MPHYRGYASRDTTNTGLRVFRCVMKRILNFPGGYSLELLVGVRRPVLETLTAFHTKICKFSIPVFRQIIIFTPGPSCSKVG